MSVGAADARATLYLPCGIQKLRRGDVSLLSTMVSFAPAPRFIVTVVEVDDEHGVAVVVGDGDITALPPFSG